MRVRQEQEVMSRESDLDLKEQIIGIVDEVAETYVEDDILANVGDYPMPSREEIIEILDEVQEVLYPGYYGNWRADRINYRY